jgi:DNA-binding CsgD family transcriptional regulator
MSRSSLRDANPLAGRDVRKQVGRGAQPEASLTPAESNVLALLPTHLSLGAIAERRGCRRSTVKTHVASIYEKLGAKTRAEAIERARAAGLLAEETGADERGEA